MDNILEKKENSVFITLKPLIKVPKNDANERKVRSSISEQIKK